MKRIICLLTLILLASTIFAASNKVYIISFSYDDGKLVFDDKTIKYGFSPDRKLTTGDYKGEIISTDETSLYSFNFNIPLTRFVDISNLTTGELSGGVIKLDSTRFALVLPYFEDGQELAIYDPDDIKILSISVEEEKEKQGFDYSLLIYLLLVIVLVVIISKILKRKR